MLPTDYDFEEFIAALADRSEELEMLNAAVIWEYARESAALCDPDQRATLFSEPEIAGDAETLRQLTPLKCSDFPNTPWLRLSERAKRNISDYFNDGRIHCFHQLSAAPHWFHFDPSAKDPWLNEKKFEKRVFVVTKRTLERYGHDKLVEEIGEHLRRFRQKAQVKAKTIGRGKRRDTFVKALRMLGYVRVSSIQGQNAAREFHAELKKKGFSARIRSISDARDFVQKQKLKLFPFLPKNDALLSAASRLNS